MIERLSEQSHLNDYYRELSWQLVREPQRMHAVPQRQLEFLQLVDVAIAFAKDMLLLELACGIGFWTEKVQKTARFVYATDICSDALSLARQRIVSERVSFARMDALSMKKPEIYISGVFGGFLLSHIRRDRLRGFFSQLDSKFAAGTQMLFLENEYADLSQRRYPFIEVDGNTYEYRHLMNGAQHLVLKNHFSDEDLIATLSQRASKVRIERGMYYWSLSYEIL